MISDIIASNERKPGHSFFSEVIFKCFTLIVTSVILWTVTGCSDDRPAEENNPQENDTYVGEARSLELGPESRGFNSSSFTLVIQAPDGSLISRDGSQYRKDNSTAVFTLSTGLADGIYRLLYFEYPIADNPELADLADRFPTAQYGLGSRIEVKNGAVSVIDDFNEEIGLPGKGTADEPYEISSYNSLMKLAQLVNSEERNGLITKDTHFRQTGKIDLYQASRECDRRYGWLPIGANSALPFRGHYHGGEISTLVIDRPNSPAVGLFGHVHNAAIYNVRMTNSAVLGNFAVGAIAGASLMSGQDRGIVTATGCEVSGCEITGSGQSVSAGAILGAVDMHSRAIFDNCNSDNNTISCSYNAGGIAGGAGLYSIVSFSSCRNSSTVSSGFSGAGGLIGTCDTIYAAASSNAGKIAGALEFNPGDTRNAGIGAGGIAGGTGSASLISCTNSGAVSGYAGVGGLVGSARVKGNASEAYMYNNVMIRYSMNEGDVSGTECVGGLSGESQCGTYAVYNKGSVSGTSYVGGIAGNTSIAVTHNAINLGKVSGHDYIGGIVAKTTFGSLALDHNYGEVTGTGTHLGGITALAGNNTIIHYCGNYGQLKYSGNGPVGGIAGEIGDPRKWTAMNITECVIGSLECVMGVVGPVMAVAGGAIEELSETLEIVLHISEVVSDCGLLVTDATLWTIGVGEMIEESIAEEMAVSLSMEVDEINSSIKSEMSRIRQTPSYSLKDFDNSALKSPYSEQIDKVLSFYESDGGDLRFNEKINKAREEREHYLEKTHKTNEIIHQVVGGVCILVGTVATVGGMVASGGLAAPFVVAGSLASLAGGLNAITKSCMEFEENAVIISQCINAGKITSPSSSHTGGLVGRLQDNSILRDCLNTADGPGHGYPFVGHAGSNTVQHRLLSLSDYYSWSEFKDMNLKAGKVCYSPKFADYMVQDLWDRTAVKMLTSNKEVTDPHSYLSVDGDWRISGNSNFWKLASGTENSFPIPSISEMTK